MEAEYDEAKGTFRKIITQSKRRNRKRYAEKWTLSLGEKSIR